MRFVIYFGNRGFFPGELVASAIADFKRVLAANGHEALVMEGTVHTDGQVAFRFFEETFEVRNQSASRDSDAGRTPA